LAVVRHVERLEQEALGAPVDLALLRQLGAGLQKLVDSSYGIGDEGAQMVEAAVRYFSWTGDGESDVGIDGLLDDLEVFNAVAEGVGRYELVIESDG